MRILGVWRQCAPFQPETLQTKTSVRKNADGPVFSWVLTRSLPHYRAGCRAILTNRCHCTRLMRWEALPQWPEYSMWARTPTPAFDRVQMLKTLKLGPCNQEILELLVVMRLELRPLRGPASAGDSTAVRQSTWSPNSSRWCRRWARGRKCASPPNAPGGASLLNLQLDIAHTGLKQSQ